MDTTLYTSLLSNQIDPNMVIELQKALDTCAQAGFICTTPDNISTFALIVGGIGIVIGILACLGFQYTYRKAKAAREAREEYERMKGP